MNSYHEHQLVLIHSLQCYFYSLVTPISPSVSSFLFIMIFADYATRTPSIRMSRATSAFYTRTIKPSLPGTNMVFHQVDGRAFSALAADYIAPFPTQGPNRSQERSCSPLRPLRLGHILRQHALDRNRRQAEAQLTVVATQNTTEPPPASEVSVESSAARTPPPRLGTPLTNSSPRCPTQNPSAPTAAEPLPGLGTPAALLPPQKKPRRRSFWDPPCSAGINEMTELVHCQPVVACQLGPFFSSPEFMQFVETGECGRRFEFGKSHVSIYGWEVAVKRRERVRSRSWTTFSSW
jgi:hypothetical protein